jgi:hypothetical protein
VATGLAVVRGERLRYLGAAADGLPVPQREIKRR